MRKTLVSVVFLLVLAFPLLADVAPVTIASPDVTTLTANGNVDIAYTITNNTSFPVSGTAKLDFSPGFIYISSRGAICTGGPDGVIRCDVPSIAPLASLTIDIISRPPAPSGHFYASMQLDVSAPPGGTFYGFTTISLSSEFVVTNAADSGPGSLRQAITDANANCPSGRPCSITFSDHFTIEPLTPLPAVDAAEITIDGAQAVEIRGTHVFGDGLVLHGVIVAVNGLTIDGFRANGIVVDQKTASNAVTISNNVITGNGLRGIAPVRGSGTIIGNTISGNDRSGIFLTADLPWKIVNNTINDNGASGIYIGPVQYQVTIEGNTISGNHDFPVGTHPDASRVAIKNTVMLNNGAPFDIGMDGPGVRNPEQYPRIQVAPAILSAVYEPSTGDTVVTIAVNPVKLYSDTFIVSVYANQAPDRAGRFEAERYLGTVTTQTDSTVVFRTHADLRGQFLTAMTLRTEAFEFTTESSSELSDGVLVQ